MSSNPTGRFSVASHYAQHPPPNVLNHATANVLTGNKVKLINCDFT